jgi:glycosyltransferase involved in cell wall biosynthesis
MHYAVPRILYRAGMLARFCTDICAAKGWPRLLSAVPPALRPPALKRLLGRVPGGLPRDRITAFSSFGLEYARRLAAAATPVEAIATHLWAGRTFCELILSTGLDGASGVYTFNSAGLELLEAARERGLAGIMEQTIAPKQIEDALLAEEHARFPGWESPPGANPYAGEFSSRERGEWDNADLILCGSDFVREGIAKAGGPAHKCAVVPYGGDFPPPPAREPLQDRPLRALFAGSVSLRKGAPYLLQAAARLGSAWQVRAVGPIQASEPAAAELRRRLELTGPVPRSEVRRHFDWATVFVFPSICEGSATVCYEALAAGLPVITTPNAGSVVRDGVDGFIVPIRDPEAIAEKLELLARDRELLAWMSANALARSREFTLEKYGERLLGAIRQAYANHQAALPAVAP